MALALGTLGESGEAFSALTTLVSRVLFFASTSARIMVAARVCEAGRTVALGTGTFRLHWLGLIAIVARRAAFTVVAFGIVFAWCADAATAIFTSHVQRGLSQGDILIVVTAIGVIVTVAFDALIDLTALGMLPFVLIVKRKTLAA